MRERIYNAGKVARTRQPQAAESHRLGASAPGPFGVRVCEGVGFSLM